MVNSSEKIKYDNLKAKLEKMQAKFDVLEQENEELRKKNKKLSEISNKQVTQLYNEIAKLNEDINECNSKKKEYEKTIKFLNDKVEELERTVSDLKSQKIKDSTNSSKPSSTNGFKKVIQNNRIKSGKSKGGQKGREGKTLEKLEKVDEVKDVYGKNICDVCGGEIEYSELEYIGKQLIDISNNLKTIEYRFHKGKCKNCGKEFIEKIPENLRNPVQYSDNLKVTVAVVKNMSNMSVETTRLVFGTLFRGLPISTGWIHNQEQTLAKNGKALVDKMKEYLVLSQVANADETGVKIGDHLGSCICFSNPKVAVYDMFPDKSKESFDEFEIFQKFTGILMHDHNKTYYRYTAMLHAECNVHICRYLKQVIDLFDRNGAKKLREFLLKIYKEKIDTIVNGQTCFSTERIAEIEEEYLKIIDEWEKEYNEAISKFKRLSQPYKDERNLFSRLREYKEEHLRFVKDFKVPFSNNEAERILRKIKIKLNTSKRFGELRCAKNYAIIASIIETAKKQGKDILGVFRKIMLGDLDVFDLSY